MGAMIPIMKNVSQQSLSVFFPAYYDEDNIGKVVEKTVKVFREVGLREYEIVIIEDGSPDKTGVVADALAKEYEHVRVVHHAKNMGYGATLKEGFQTAKYDYVFYTDGDDQFDLADLKKFLQYIPEYDIVTGYRINKQYSPYRKMVSFVYNMLIGLLFGTTFKDINCAFKLVKTDLFKKITIDSTEAFIDAEVLIKAQRLGYSIKEIGVTHLPRATGISTGARIPVILGTIKEAIYCRIVI